MYTAAFWVGSDSVAVMAYWLVWGLLSVAAAFAMPYALKRLCIDSKQEKRFVRVVVASVLMIPWPDYFFGRSRLIAKIKE